MKHLASSRVLVHVLWGGLGFLGLCLLFGLDSLIVITDGAFGGAIAALLVAFGPLLYNTLRNVEPYSRARQMTLGWFALWLAYVLAAYVSVWNRAIGDPPANPNYISALSRYVAVYAAALQVTAPDFGLGLFSGRNRKILWASIIIGLIVAAVIWVAQDQAILSGVVADIFARNKIGIIRMGLGLHEVANT